MTHPQGERPHPPLSALCAAHPCYTLALERAARLICPGRTALLGIDGRCGSGKTALAALLEQALPCAVFHMDDFYLPVAARRPDWREVPCANMDFERLLREVLRPLRQGQGGRYTAYDCHRGTGRSVAFEPPPLAVVEGSYSHAPALADCYDAKFFVTCTPEVQRRRLLAREGAERLRLFESLWIPLEEGYFRRCRTEAASGLILDTSGENKL